MQVIRWLSAAALALLIAAGPARADYAIKDGNGASQTVKSITLGGAIQPQYTMVDPTGTTFGTTSNPVYVYPATGATFPVSIAASVAVTGTFFQATQPISAASLPLPTGAGTAANQASLIANQTNGTQQAKVTDGTNVGTVKAANTAAAAGDTGQVVNISPNSPDTSFGTYSTASITETTGITFTANTGWNNSTPTFFSFTSACRANGRQVVIPQIDIWSTANPTLKLSGTLWLFSGVPGTNVTNNATFTIAAADFTNLTGGKAGFNFTLANNQTNTGAANSSASLTGTTFQAQCASGSTTITGMVEVNNAYVSTTGEVLNVGLSIIGVN